MSNEIEGLKVRVDGLERQQEKQFDKIETSIAKVWAKIDEYRNGQIVTQTIVEGIRKEIVDGRIDNGKVFDKITNKLDDLKNDMNKAEIKRVEIDSLNTEKMLISQNNISERQHSQEDKQSSKWEKHWAKIASAAIAILLSIILYKLGLK